MYLIFNGIGSEKVNCLLETIRTKPLQTKPPLKQSAAERLTYADTCRKSLLKVISKYKPYLSKSVLLTIKSDRLNIYYELVVFRLLKENPGLPEVQELYRKLQADSLLRDVTGNNLPQVVDVYNLTKEYALLDHAINSKTKYDQGFYQLHPDLVYGILENFYKQNIDRDFLLANYIFNGIEKNGLDSVMEICTNKYLETTNHSSQYFKEVQNYQQKMRNNLKSGNIAYNFKLINPEGKKVSLSDFRGDVVILDYWFTGCQGCKMMVPVLNELEQYFAGKKVRFISISIDKDKKRWKKYGLPEYSSKDAVQLFTNGEGENNALIKYYDIKSYPTLQVIGKAGNIVDARAPDPRDPEQRSQMIKTIEKSLEN